VPIHQEDFASRDSVAAPPDRQRPAAPIPLERLADRDAVDGDGAVRAADCLPWKGKDALEERHAFGQITAIGEEAGERFRRPDHDKVGDVEHACRLHGIEADGDAGAGVPDQPRRRVKENRKPDGEHREIGRYDISEARHGSVRRRLSQAAWRSRRYGRGCSPAARRLWTCRQ
jgi:hypothetical protein